ncbi:hypothetical protein SNK05_005386 [Fusarium graminearum]
MRAAVSPSFANIWQFITAHPPFVFSSFYSFLGRGFDLGARLRFSLLRFSLKLPRPVSSPCRLPILNPFPPSLVLVIARERRSTLLRRHAIITATSHDTDRS